MQNNYMQAIIPGYLATLDGMMSYIVDSANKVKQAQILILVLEGVALALVAVLYVWRLSSQVVAERFKIYAIFMAIPQVRVYV